VERAERDVGLRGQKAMNDHEIEQLVALAERIKRIKADLNAIPEPRRDGTLDDVRRLAQWIDRREPLERSLNLAYLKLKELCGVAPVAPRSSDPLAGGRDEDYPAEKYEDEYERTSRETGIPLRGDRW